MGHIAINLFVICPPTIKTMLDVERPRRGTGKGESENSDTENLDICKIAVEMSSPPEIRIRKGTESSISVCGDSSKDHSVTSFEAEDISMLKVRPPSFRNSKSGKYEENMHSVIMRKLSEEEELLKESEEQENAGEITVLDDEAAGFDDDPDETVDWLADKEDFQRPAKIEILVGFLRLVCFLSVCTSVFGVVVSILFPIQQTKGGVAVTRSQKMFA